MNSIFYLWVMMALV